MLGFWGLKGLVRVFFGFFALFRVMLRMFSRMLGRHFFMGGFYRLLNIGFLCRGWFGDGALDIGGVMSFVNR